MPTFTGSVSGSGLIDGDSLAAAISGSPAYATAATFASYAGDYAITPSAGTLASTLGYRFAYVPGQLTVTAWPLNIQAVIPLMPEQPVSEWPRYAFASPASGTGGIIPEAPVYVDAALLQSLGYEPENFLTFLRVSGSERGPYTNFPMESGPMRLFCRRCLASESGLSPLRGTSSRDELGLPTGPICSYPLSRIGPKWTTLYANADHNAAHCTFLRPRTSSRPNPRSVFNSPLIVSMVELRCLYTCLAAAVPIR